MKHGLDKIRIPADWYCEFFQMKIIKETMEACWRDRFRIRAISKLAHLRYHRSKHDLLNNFVGQIQNYNYPIVGAPLSQVTRVKRYCRGIYSVPLN